MTHELLGAWLRVPARHRIAAMATGLLLAVQEETSFGYSDAGRCSALVIARSKRGE